MAAETDSTATVVPADEQGQGSASGPEPTVESAADFAAEVIGRLVQEAFYASDASFVEPYVASASFDEVVGGLDARVRDVRWAIATFPGETKRTWFASAPLSVEVPAFDADAGTATVEVWVVTVFSREDLGAPETRFVFEVAELEWDGDSDRWLIIGLESQAAPGAPLAADQSPATPAELDGLLDGHELVGVGEER